LTPVVVQRGLVWTTCMPHHYPGCSDRLRARQEACTPRISNQQQRCSRRRSTRLVRQQLLARGSRAQRPSGVHAGTLRTSKLDVRARPQAHRARCLQWSAPARDPISAGCTELIRQPPSARVSAVSLLAQAWPILASHCERDGGRMQGQARLRLRCVVLSSSCHCGTLACRTLMLAAMLATGECAQPRRAQVASDRPGCEIVQAGGWSHGTQHPRRATEPREQLHYNVQDSVTRVWLECALAACSPGRALWLRGWRATSIY